MKGGPPPNSSLRWNQARDIGSSCSRASTSVSRSRSLCAGLGLSVVSRSCLHWELLLLTILMWQKEEKPGENEEIMRVPWV